MNYAMPKPTNSGRWKRALFSLIGPSRSRNLLAGIVRKRVDKSGPFAFPIEGASFRRVLIIFPADPVQALCQLENAAALIKVFSDARVSLLAEPPVAPLAGMLGSGEIIEYRSAEKQLFSPGLASLIDRFKGEIDCCCLLTREEDLSLAYLAGMTGARLRAGYGGAADFPFINLRVNLDSGNRYLAGSNCTMAETFGAPPCSGRTWSFPAGASGEVDRLLREVRLDGSSRLFGIDVLPLYKLFGDRGAEECISALMTAAVGGVYFFCGEAPPRPIAERLAALVAPVFSALTIPQTAELLRRTACIVSGKSLFFGLATMLGIKAVGIFTENELPLYCKPSSKVRGIHCSGKGRDEEAVTSLLAAVRELGSS